MLYNYTVEKVQSKFFSKTEVQVGSEHYRLGNNSECFQKGIKYDLVLKFPSLAIALYKFRPEFHPISPWTYNTRPNREIHWPSFQLLHQYTNTIYPR